MDRGTARTREALLWHGATRVSRPRAWRISARRLTLANPIPILGPFCSRVRGCTTTTTCRQLSRRPRPTPSGSSPVRAGRHREVTALGRTGLASISSRARRPAMRSGDDIARLRAALGGVLGGRRCGWEGEQWHLSTPAFRDDATSRAGAMATVSPGARALMRTAEVTEGP